MDTGDCFSYDTLTWQGQREIAEAVPTALLYGEIPQKKTNIWIYLDKTMPALIWHSYFFDGHPDQVLTVEQALEEAVPCRAFQLATTPKKLDALATYYFMRKKLAKKYELVLTWEQERTLKTMIGDEPPSKIVKLRVRIPEDHFLDSQSTDRIAYRKYLGNDLRKALSSKAMRLGPPLASSGSDANNDAKRNSHSRTSSEATSVDPTETIDRFLELEDQNHELRDDLDFHEGNIKDLKRRMTEIETQMKEELQAVELIIAQREERDLEKKRLWETMSKEEIRELGRRDSMTKRPKHG